MMNMDDCRDMLGVPVLGIVPDDEELMVSALVVLWRFRQKISGRTSIFKYCRKTYGAKVSAIMNLMKRKVSLIRLKKLEKIE